MVVLEEQVQFRLSGGANNNNPFVSLGGVVSATQIKDDALDAFVDQISITQQQTGHTDYYCFYVFNGSSTSQMSDTKIWFTVLPSFMSMGLGSAPVGGTEQVINQDTTPPASVTFSQPTTQSTALSIGNIPPSSYKSVWVRRIIPAGVMPTSSVLVRIKIDALNA
jgi:hypothetical protein